MSENLRGKDLESEDGTEERSVWSPFKFNEEWLGEILGSHGGEYEGDWLSSGMLRLVVCRNLAAFLEVFTASTTRATRLNSGKDC
jgi:hypothetical protein